MRRLALGAMLAAACGQTPTESFTEFVVSVDSVSAPAVVAPWAEFTAAFHGTIGESSCYSLARTEERQFPSALEITFVGARCVEGNGFAIVTELTHAELLRAPGSGSFVIRVRQPDGATLEKRVSVR